MCDFVLGVWGRSRFIEPNKADLGLDWIVYSITFSNLCICELKSTVADKMLTSLADLIGISILVYGTFSLFTNYFPMPYSIYNNI